MHEMSTVVRMVNLAMDVAKQNNLKKIYSITVDIGEMTDILPEYMDKYYKEAVNGTELDGSKLIMNMVPAKAECLNCGETFHPDRTNNYSCTGCKSIKCKILEGRSTVLKSVEGE